jgi:hypothetical protein
LTVLDNLAAVELLRPLADDEKMPLGSACVAPLIYADRLLGVLVALAPGATVFFPKDLRSLEIYAGHAAIAPPAVVLERKPVRLVADGLQDAQTGGPFGQ